MSDSYDTSTDIGASPKDFFVKDNYWWYQPPSKKTDEPRPPYLVSGYFKITRVHDVKSDLWGRIIDFKNALFKSKKIFVSDDLSHDTARKLSMTLSRAGMFVNTGQTAHEKLQDLINNMPGRIHVFVDQCGWVKNDTDEVAFVMPSGEVIGAPGILMRPERAMIACEPRGELAEWRREIAANAVGNTRLAMAMNITFAAPLLKDTNRPNGGVHFNGKSQIGKTTITQCAASVIGNPTEPPEGILTSWHATQNAVEAIFSRSNDCLLAMDEMSQAPANDVAAIIYKMGNGAGKGRMKADSSFRDGYQWRTLAISTGEEKAEHKIRQAKGRMTAGVDARLANVPADPGKGLGVFENLHGFQSAKALSDHLRAASKRFYGTAFPAFITRLVEARKTPEFLAKIEEDCNQFIKEYVPNDASSQVKSVAHRFALAAVAGELATEWEILPWKQGEATKAAVACMNDWIEDRGSVGQGEQTDIVEQLREYLSVNMISKFPPGIDDYEHGQIRGGEIVGVRLKESEDFAIFKGAWKKVMPDVNAARAMKVLQQAGFVERNRDSYLWSVDERTAKPVAKKTGCYIIRKEILE